MEDKKRKSSRRPEAKESPRGKRGSGAQSSLSMSPRKKSQRTTGEWEDLVESIDTVEKRNRTLYVSVMW